MADTPQKIQRRTLSVLEAAAYLGIGRAKLYQLKDAGELPFVNIGRRVLFDIADLDEFLEASKSH